MFGKALAFTFSFFGVIAAGPLIVVIAVFVFKFDARTFADQHTLATAIIVAVYAFIWVMAYFGLQDYFIVWKPQPGIVPVSKAELLDKLQRSFKKPLDGAALFDVFRSNDDRVAITWASSIDYFQVVSTGGISKKRVVVLTLDEKRNEAYFLIKEKDLKWSLSTNRFDFSMNFSAGIFAEISTEAVPSVTVANDGSFSIDVKKLKYDYRELWLPIENTLLMSGWTIRGGMLPKLSYRLALSTPLALLMFFLFISFPAKPTISPDETRPINREAYEKNETKHTTTAAKSEVTSNLEFALDGFMKVPKEYFGNHKSDFVTYSKDYMKRNDKDPGFVAKIKKFAKKNVITLEE